MSPLGARLAGGYALAKDLWLLAWLVAISANTVEAFVEGNDVLEACRRVIGIAWILATVFVAVTFVAHRRRHRAADAARSRP